MSVLDALLERFRDRGDEALSEPEAVAGRDRAVLELMLLVSLADDVSSEAEREAIRDFAAARPWPAGTTPETEVAEATAAVRAARAAPEGLRSFVEGLCVRIDHVEDQAFALDHLRAVAESDGALDPAELDFLDALRAELGLPT